MTTDQKRQAALAEEIARLTAEVEGEIARRERELAEERQRILAARRQEGEKKPSAPGEGAAPWGEELDPLEEEYRVWQQADREREAALLAVWSA
ncbi:MAG: hypothetical protein GX493_01010 [Firmicutes bacterium]|nr:hypothetical protein [Bacillota bacterium]